MSAGAVARSAVMPFGASSDQCRVRRRNRDLRDHSTHVDGPGVELSMSILAGVPVVRCRGRLGRESVRACSQILARAVAARPRCILIDLTPAEPDGDTPAVLALAHRFAGRHGVRLALVGMPASALAALRPLTPACEVYPTLASALAAALAESHRPLPRPSSRPS